MKIESGIREKIEKARNELDMIFDTDVGYEEVLEKSREIDKLINEFYKI